MPSYKAPIKDNLFLLSDVFHIYEHAEIPGYAELSPDIVEATLNEAAKLSEKVLAPLNRIGDEEGCHRQSDGSVATPKGFKEAFKQYTDGGWMGMAAPAEFGGQELPVVLSGIVGEFMASSNLAFAMFPALTQGAISALLNHASTELKSLYVPNMVAGKWTGTMNLTESQAGTDLGLLRTKAKRQADGSYRISGSKVFISAGEHDMAENIIHLVLARIEGAPAGTKGISLFVVPKFIPKADGSLGGNNNVSCGSIEHKMGIHGNCTCVMNFDDATGWLVGSENRGLNAMFTMMNNSRLGVGILSLGLSEVAYQNAAAYAKDRLQGRSLSGAKFLDKPADPIIVHPDVRRSLMTIRAMTEAARALAVWTGLRHDVALRSKDAKASEAADDHMGLLTPVLKAFNSDLGFENAVMAQQIYGGHGYIAENGMEQFVRDVRICQIYEGANGIQALDLAGRKIAINEGRAVKAFFLEVDGYLNKQRDQDSMAFCVKPVRDALGRLQQATMWIAKHAVENHDEIGAASYEYLRLFGLTAYGYMWCRMVEAAQRTRPGASGDTAMFLDAKIATARFFMERILPENSVLLTRIEAGAASMMELPAEGF